MSITSKIYKGDDKIVRLYKGDKKVLFMTRGNRIIYADWGPFTFNATGVIQTLVLPKLIKKIHVDCVASKGRDVTSSSLSATGGLGGRVQCDLSVNGGETLYIMVGGIPNIETPVYNASDIRIGGNTLNDRVIVAGGGGGGFISRDLVSTSANGGAGGGEIGQDGYIGISWGGATKATGGTQSSGGTGGRAATGYENIGGDNGTLGLGGAGKRGIRGIYSLGAGGAGYYGGGGGAGSCYADEDYWLSASAGGAGGSSYTNSDCSNVVHTQGYNDGAGYVTISFVE